MVIWGFRCIDLNTLSSKEVENSGKKVLAMEKGAGDE